MCTSVPAPALAPATRARSSAELLTIGSSQILENQSISSKAPHLVYLEHWGTKKIGLDGNKTRRGRPR